MVINGDVLKKYYKIKLLPVAFIASIILVCIMFFKFYLNENAKQFGEDFYKQNLHEITIGDSYSLIRRLNNLSNTINWRCISGSKNSQIFYKKVKGPCTDSFFQKKIYIPSNKNSNLIIEMTLRLPKDLEVALVVFILLLIIILLIIYKATQVFVENKMLFENKMNQLIIDNKMEQAQIISDIAGQVAHDIRSPLAALEMALKDENTLSGNKKDIIFNATNRIQQISNDLLKKNRSLTTEKVLVNNLLRSIVSEKKIQYSKNNNLKIEHHLSSDISEIFLMLNPQEFNRVISNLINNSVEAIDSGLGTIEIKTEKTDNSIQIQIIDNGKGISKKHLKLLGAKGISFGKKQSDSSGSGLGLYHAKKTVQLWGGSLIIESIENKQTTITLLLPILSLQAIMEVILIDNDSLICLAWEEKAKKNNIAFKYFETIFEFEKNKINISKQCQIYIDSDLGDEVKGEVYAQKLYDQGYENLYLATGYDAAKFSQFKFLKGIVGKIAPWSL